VRKIRYKDERDLGGSETFVMLMDLNADGKHDITMGISSIVSNNFYNVPNSLINCPGPMCGWKVSEISIKRRFWI
jgi:hypothetical protein